MKKTFSGIVLGMMVAFFLMPHLAQAQGRVAGVHILKPGEDLEAKQKNMGLAFYMDFDQNAKGDAFLLISPKAKTRLEIFELKMGEDSKFVFGKLLNSVDMQQENAAFVLRHRVSEGIPNLAVCFRGSEAERTCWVPRYEGVNGALVLDPGFYPVRDKGENAATKKYEQAKKAFISGPDYLAGPLFFVERLKDQAQLNKMAKENRFTPKGKFDPKQPHHFLFVSTTIPITIKLHVMEYRGGDGFLNPKPVAEIKLNDVDGISEAAVFSIDLNTFKATNKDDLEKGYIFVTEDKHGEYMWTPQIDQATGKFTGYGFGRFGNQEPIEAFMQWHFN